MACLLCARHLEQRKAMEYAITYLMSLLPGLCPTDVPAQWGNDTYTGPFITVLLIFETTQGVQCRELGSHL